MYLYIRVCVLVHKGLNMIIKRVCGAIIRKNKILMVLHKHNKIQYWTLPGGGVECDESPEEAIIREILEETKLETIVIKNIFDEISEKGICRCFLMKEINTKQKALLGFDPEESNLLQKDRLLQKLKWQSLEKFKSDKQVKLVIAHLDL